MATKKITPKTTKTKHISKSDQSVSSLIFSINQEERLNSPLMYRFKEHLSYFGEADFYRDPAIYEVLLQAFMSGAFSAANILSHGEYEFDTNAEEAVGRKTYDTKYVMFEAMCHQGIRPKKIENYEEDLEAFHERSLERVAEAFDIGGADFALKSTEDVKQAKKKPRYKASKKTV